LRGECENKHLPQTKLEEKSETIEIKRQLEIIREICEETSDLESAGIASLKAGYKILDIGNMGVPLLLNEFTNSANDWKYRWLVCELLSKIGDESIVEPMVNVLTNSNDINEVRIAAAKTLGKLKTHAAVDVLLTLI